MVSLRAHLAGFALAGITLSAAASADIAPFLEAQAGLKSWTADFLQTRTLKSLKQPLKTPGHLFFVAPNIFRWELGDPAQTIALRTANEVLLLYPPLKRAERYSLGPTDRSQWQEMLSLLDAGFPRSQKELESRFQIISGREEGGRTHFVLQPKAASARRWMREMELVFDAATKSLAATELRFADGSSLRNDFSNERKNADISPESFRPQIPTDYKVIEPANRK
ncbi:MAG TPA: outer membrane lipoprotein carrier protein LolA [Verrucomicrobiae bacterium]|nr:outer membrane lipoprotein carrier protein LolA [Verrucomicrobiae bacterium]